MPRHVDGSRVEDAPKPETEVRHLVDTIARCHPDLVGICEIGPAQVPDLRRRLAERGIDLPHTEITGGADPERHLALLSRLPIVARDSQSDLTYRLEGDVLAMQRGILDATIAMPDGARLRCIGVHLKSKREIPRFDQAAMRRHEASLLRRHIDRILEADPDTKLLVYGDFNDTRNEPAVRHIIGPAHQRLHSVDVTDDRGRRWTHHWQTADLYARIDFLLVSGALRQQVDESRSFIPHDPDFPFSSDHRPLVLRLRLP